MRPETGAFGIFQSPLPWALLFGLAPLAAFPPLEWHLTAWVAFSPLLLALRSPRGTLKEWFFAGWVMGAVFYAGHFFWLHRALVELSGMALVPFLVFFSLLVAGLGLNFGAGCLLVRWCRQSKGWHPFWTFPAWLAVQDWMLSEFPFGGVAWGSLAATQPHTLAARLIVPIIGAPGLVLLMGAVNACWAWGLQAVWPTGLGKRHGGTRWPALGGAGLAVLVITTVTLAWPLAAGVPEPGARRMTSLLVPGGLSIAQLNATAGYNTEGSNNTVDFNAAGYNTVRYYLARTMAGFDSGGGSAPDGRNFPGANPGARKALVIWPESSARGHIEKGKTLVELSQLGGLLQADFLLGSDARERGRDFNSLYLVGGGVFEVQRYDKRRLVPFGEFVPPGFQWMFGKKVTAGEKDYAAGTLPPVLPWRGVRLGLAICFESVLPGHLRAAVLEGAEAVITVANDAWLTRSAALHHLRLTALRGLEAGRDIVFVSNGGWNALLRDGRVVSGGADREQAFWAHPALRNGHTPWILWGNWLLAALLTAWVGAGAFFSLRHGNRPL
ncbi:MAG: nitrilase-related carbon-nitrogen hydrolase [bacterium]